MSWGLILPKGLEAHVYNTYRLKGWEEKKRRKKKRNGDFVFKEDESVSVVRANVYTYMHMQVE